MVLISISVKWLNYVGVQSRGRCSLSILRRCKPGHGNRWCMTSHCSVHLANFRNQCIAIEASHSDICDNDVLENRSKAAGTELAGIT